MEVERTYTAFAGDRLVVSGELETMLVRVKERLDRGETAPILIFEDQTGTELDFDFSGTREEMLARISAHPWFASQQPPPAKVSTGPGRPKLGVVCREVSLLPRHWEWLERQPGGISGALRRLVDDARKKTPGVERARLAREAASKFMWVMAGNLAGFEEASRALFAQDHARLQNLIRDWPPDIRGHLERLVSESIRLEKDAPE